MSVTCHAQVQMFKCSSSEQAVSSDGMSVTDHITNPPLVYFCKFCGHFIYGFYGFD